MALFYRERSSLSFAYADSMLSHIPNQRYAGSMPSQVPSQPLAMSRPTTTSSTPQTLFTTS